LNFLTIIIGLILAFVLMQVYLVIKSKRTAGKPIPFENINNLVAEKIKNKKGLLYFFSPNCHSCKTQTPIIDKLKNEFPNIISIDLSKDIGTARAFSIMGTPAIVFVNNNFVDSIHLGVKSETFIRNKFANSKS